MIALSITLLVLGVIFLLLEMWLTGVEFFGIVGIACLMVSAVLAVMFVPNGWIIVVGQIAVIAAFVFHIYRFMRRKQLKGKLILSDMLDAPQTGDISYLIGREGTTLTLLKPYGDAIFNGTRMQVSSIGPMIEQNTKVKVVEVQSNKIIVAAVDAK